MSVGGSWKATLKSLKRLREFDFKTCSHAEVSDFANSLNDRDRTLFNILHADWQSRQPEYMSATAARAAKRMDYVETLPKDIRELIYEYDLPLIRSFLDHGVRNARSIKFLICAARGDEFKVNSGVIGAAANSTISRPKNSLREEADDGELYSLTDAGRALPRTAA